MKHNVSEKEHSAEYLSVESNCACKDSKKGLFIPHREVSWVVAVIVTTTFFIFIAGYFWGQRKAVSSLLEKIDKESFSDKVTYSLYTMNGKYQNDTDESEEDADNDEEEEDTSELKPVDSVALVALEEPLEEKNEVSITYMAPLVGFSTLAPANQFMQKIKKSGIDVSVKKRVSKTAKGRTVAWYQVVTGEYIDKNEIEHVVMRLSEKENLKNVKIIEIKKG